MRCERWFGLEKKVEADTHGEVEGRGVGGGEEGAGDEDVEFGQRLEPFEDVVGGEEVEFKAVEIVGCGVGVHRGGGDVGPEECRGEFEFRFVFDKVA